ncbi:MAG TPA: DUF1707 domain-containing protein [Actinomycetota bacterium]|nr:DUF1707 domain-containing protein [Actinomycetota bacterium]
MPTGQRDEGQTLASDAERELVCTQLQEACVQGRLTMEELSPRLEAALAARTRADLLDVIRDLPAGPLGLPPGPPPKRWHLGLMGSTKRAGRWRIPAESWWGSLMGSCRLDLTRAVFEAPVTTINIATWMGSVEVRVPRGYEIRVEGTALMGGKHLRLYGPTPPPGAPVIRLRVVACLGAVKVTDRESIRSRLRQR